MPSLMPIVPIQELSSTELRDALVKMISNANDVSVRNFYSKITKKHIHSSCAVQAAPKAKWRPRVNVGGAHHHQNDAFENWVAHLGD